MVYQLPAPLFLPKGHYWFQQFDFFCGIIWCNFCGTQNHLGWSQFCSIFFLREHLISRQPHTYFPAISLPLERFFLLPWSAVFRMVSSGVLALDVLLWISTSLPQAPQCPWGCYLQQASRCCFLNGDSITMNSWICSWLFIFPMGYGICVFFPVFLRVPEANPRNRVVLSHR